VLSAPAGIAGRPGSAVSVHLRDQVAVGGPGGFELVVAFGQLAAQFGVVLLQTGDLLLELAVVLGEPGGSWAAARSVISEARLTEGPPAGDIGGSAALAMIWACSSRWR
jgi:hypothetical protein